MSENKNVNKPASVLCEEFKTSLTKLVNESLLPAFIIEPILKSVYLETKAVVQKQYEYDKKMYEEAISQSK